mmetsp:Transcript_11352/g.48415  ORF Transcript_11352/g.48415 Transcript_11352/m.48415 type:complete len:367 (-) Transcript_11352:115-1215(-)
MRLTGVRVDDGLVGRPEHAAVERDARGNPRQALANHHELRLRAPETNRTGAEFQSPVLAQPDRGGQSARGLLTSAPRVGDEVRGEVPLPQPHDEARDERRQPQHQGDCGEHPRHVLETPQLFYVRQLTAFRVLVREGDGERGGGGESHVDERQLQQALHALHREHDAEERRRQNHHVDLLHRVRVEPVGLAPEQHTIHHGHPVHELEAVPEQHGVLLAHLEHRNAARARGETQPAPLAQRIQRAQRVQVDEQHRRDVEHLRVQQELARDSELAVLVERILRPAHHVNLQQRDAGEPDPVRALFLRARREGGIAVPLGGREPRDHVRHALERALKGCTRAGERPHRASSTGGRRERVRGAPTRAPAG